MPFHGPVKRGRMVSVTSITPSALTCTSTSKLWMTSSLAAAGAAASSRKEKRRARRRIRHLRARLAGAGFEADLGRFALRGVGQLEELARLEGEKAGDEVRGEHLDLGVEVAHHGVVVAAGVLDGLFNLAERVLELREALDGAQLRVGFGQREELPQRPGQDVLSCGLGRRPLGAHGGAAGLDDVLER